MSNTLSFLDELPPQARRWLPLTIVAMVGLVGLAATEYVAGTVASQTYQAERNELVGQLTTIRARLEGEVNATLYLTRGLTSYVATHPTATDRELDMLAAEIVRDGRHIRNIGLAPDNVIRFLHPFAGNERAMGFDYRKNAEQWPAVERAINLGSTVVAGPVSLVQGGRAFIARTPIFEASETRPYWGLASVVIDSPSLLVASGIGRDDSRIEIALRGSDGQGANGGMIYGRSIVFEADPVRLNVLIPNGEWELAAIPRGGWRQQVTDVWAVRGVGFAFTTLVTTLVFLLFAVHRRSRQLALHDPLTGLPNRRLLKARLEQLISLAERMGLRFTIFFIDLDNLNTVHERFGHAGSEQLLAEVGRRLLTCTRRGDTVARTGGNQFVAVMPDHEDNAGAVMLAKRLSQEVVRPVYRGEKIMQVTSNIGWAVFPDDGEDIEALLRLAGQRMRAGTTEEGAGADSDEAS